MIAAAGVVLTSPHTFGSVGSSNFWEQLPHAQASVTKEGLFEKPTLALRILRSASDSLGVRASWDKLEDVLTGASYRLAHAATNAANVVTSGSSFGTGAASGSGAKAAAGRAAEAVGAVGRGPGGHGVTDALWRMVGIDPSKLRGPAWLADHADRFVQRYMGWEIHPVYPW